MNNHRDLSGLVFNILIVVFVLVVIVVGLNRIGIYDLPDGIEKILGTYTVSDSDVTEKGNNEHESIVYDGNNDVSVETSDNSFENAKVLLSSVAPYADYRHEISAEYFGSDGTSYIDNISVQFNKGMYSASVSDADGNVKKQINYKDDSVEIITHNGDDENSVSVPVGEFDISDECGFILTAESFVKSDYVLDDASFSLSHGQFGGELTISFESTLSGYTQKEIYTVSLDYGIVVSAKCYENENLIYSMTTKTLSRI